MVYFFNDPGTGPGGTMSQRRLAAIMFTDIVGYSALMESDEKKAFEVLGKNRNIQKPFIKKYRRKWLKEMGIEYSPTGASLPAKTCVRAGLVPKY